MLLILLFSCDMRLAKSASAVDGKADLSSGIDFEGGEVARLDGEWEFRRGALLTPMDFRPDALPAGGHVSSGTMRVPGLWAAVNGFEAPRPEVTGTGTLRLVVSLPPGERAWGLRIPNANSALKLFVDGQLLAELGSVSERKDATYLPSNGLSVKNFTASGRVEIVMQVANFSTPYIGTWDSLLLGSADAIASRHASALVSTALISGALLIMGLYHLGIFLLRRNDRSVFIFGVICLFMTVRNLIMGERILLNLFPHSVLGWEWAFKIEHLSAHLVVPLFALFFRTLYPRYMRKGAVLVILSVAAAWGLLILGAPAILYHRFLHWYEFFLLGAGFYAFASLMLAAVRREKGALMVLVGLTFLMGTATNDVLLSIGAIKGTFYMASYGVFLYIFTQSFHLSMIFSKAFKDIEELSEGLQAKNRELEALHTIDLAIASSMELDMILEVILEQAREHLGVDAADILLLETGSDTLSLGARLGFRTEALVHTRLKAGQGFAGQALLSEKPIIVSHLDRDAEGFKRSPAFAGEGFVLYAGSRLTVKDKIVGVIELYRRRSFAPSPSWELFFKTLAGQAAIALENSALLLGLRTANAELEEANEGTIESWAEALELRDQETEGHSRRVTETTVAMGRSFGLSGVELDRLRRGALLHDIGKMGIPDSILLKPGPLDADEYAVMKRHPAIARNLLSRLSFLREALDIPYCHHEKWDGSGYPQGLSGEAIPLPARLFAVVDVWDALLSDRPYRQAWSEDRVLAHIASLSGTHFDPRAVEVFLEMRCAAGAPVPTQRRTGSAPQ